MFTGKVNFLAYLNTTSFTSSILTDGYFAESNGSLVFVKYESFTISGTWELASNDVLLYGLKVGIDSSYGTNFECTLTGTGNFAVISGASGKYITTQNFTAYVGSQSIVPTYTAGNLYEFWVFVDSGCTGIDLNAADPVAYLIGGEIPIAVDTLNAASTSIRRVEPTIFDSATNGVLVSLDISGCKLSVGQVNKLITTLASGVDLGAFDSSCVIDISGQVPTAAPTDDVNLTALISKIRSQVTTFATD